MPTVILEAMACGLAIIATDVGAVSRQIDENGILIADPDVAKIKKAMEKIINMSDQQLINMKTRSIEKIREEFLWSRIIEQKIKNFQNITQKNEKNQMT
jgi:glycosyltransferase involved in cell wall biosynthesis